MIGLAVTCSVRTPGCRGDIGGRQVGEHLRLAYRIFVEAVDVHADQFFGVGIWQLLADGNPGRLNEVMPRLVDGLGRIRIEINNDVPVSFHTHIQLLWIV